MTQAYTRIRILVDETVNCALQSTLDRGKNWLRISSITDYAEKMCQQATLENYGQAEMPEWDDQASKNLCFKKNENKCRWKRYLFKKKLSGENIRKHSLPGNAWKIWHDLEILHVQSEERYTEIPTQLLFGHPPTQTNLLQWGTSVSNLCKLCLRADAELQVRRQKATNQILNGCKVALHQKRYTWRHNNLIKYITGLIDIDRFFMYADIPSHTLPGGGTVVNV